MSRYGHGLSRRIFPYLLISPMLAYIGVWTFYPILRTFYFSFFKAPKSHSLDFYFVGLDNYFSLFHDRVFWLALYHNMAWVLLSIVIPLTLSLIIAVLLVDRKNRLFYSTIYFLPRTVAYVIAAVVFGWIYNPTFGALNTVLDALHLSQFKLGWLGDPRIALISVNMIGSWGYYGFCVVILLSGLQLVDYELYDASKVDGANAWQRFIHITVPSISSTIQFLLIYTLIGSMTFFDLVYVATKGGPEHSTEIIGTYMFTLFIRFGDINYAASVSTVQTAVILAFTFVLVRSLYVRR